MANTFAPVYSPVEVPQNYLCHPALVTFQAVGDSARTANSTYLHDIYVTAPNVITAFSIAHGAVSAGNLDLGIYDANGNLLTHTGVTPVTAINTLQKINLPVALPIGPGVYFLGFWLDNGTDTYFARQNLNPLGAWGNIRGSANTNAGGLLSSFSAMGGTNLITTCVPFIANVQGGL